jgi:hypothetical protein
LTTETDTERGSLPLSKLTGCWAHAAPIHKTPAVAHAAPNF